MKIELTVNGVKHVIDVKPNETLASVLRSKLKLTGVKIGCNRGECGACTVLMDGKPVVSCLVLAVEAEGKSILTIEGLADPKTGELHPIQKAFVENFGLQCGFCTPGMIMSAKALLDENPNPTLEEIKEALVGNICRCGAYPHIFKSILAAAAKMRQKGECGE